VSVHSDLLAAAVQGTTEATLYTVPTGKRTIVKSVVACNTNAAANIVAIEGYSAGTLIWFYRVYLAIEATSGDSSLTLPWIVMDAGQQLRAVATKASAYLAISGSELNI
jgi:hypothetical protein